MATDRIDDGPRSPLPVTASAVAVATTRDIVEVMGRPEAHVLVVCDAGVDRAAYAALALAAELERRGIREVAVEAAGVSAEPGRPLPRVLADLFRERGAAGGAFRSRRLTGRLVDDADLVVCATESIRRRVLALRPFSDRRVFALGQLERLMPAATPRVETRTPAARVRRLATVLDELRAERGETSSSADDLRLSRLPGVGLDGRGRARLDRAVLALADAVRPLVKRGRDRSRA